MPYLYISDFKYGLDRRRPRVAGVPGTLWNLKNAHISRGGDIERAKKFVAKHSLPENTFGLGIIREQLYVFGSVSTPSGMPIGVEYQRLQAPSSAAMTSVLDVKAFDGKLYVIAEFADGNVYHFYDGSRVTDWDDRADANTDFVSLAAYLAAKIDADDAVKATSSDDTIRIEAAVAGTAFTISKSTTDVGTYSVGSIDITGGTNNPGTNYVNTITVDGTDILGANVDWATSHEATATAVAAQITSNTSSPNFTATADGATITITAVAAGTASNGDAVSGTVAGDVTIGNAVAMAGGSATDQDITLTEVQANVAAVTEVRATGTITITGGSSDPGTNYVSDVTVDGSSILGGETVDWVLSNDATASALASAINNWTSTTGYSASAATNVVTIQADVGEGSAPNGDVVAFTGAGDVTGTTGNISSGVDAVTAVAQIYTAQLTGTFEAEDTFTITINGTDYKATGRAAGTGTYAHVSKKRVWSTADSLFVYSKLNDASDFTDASASSGSGIINMSNDSEGSERLVSAALYEDKTAIFSRDNIRVYTLNTDAAEIAFSQNLANTGTLAPRSIVPYGNNDVFFLDSTGIRSLRARDSSGAAFVTDPGSAVDPYVKDLIADLSEYEVSRAVSAFEPTDGRYWLGLGDSIMVYSHFPGSKIAAWSTYEPGFTPSDVIRSKGKIYVRGGDTIYLYGGDDGDTYPDADEQVVTVETPFMSGEAPATHKGLTGFDTALTNAWDTEILVDPNDETATIDVGVIDKITYGLQGIHVPGWTPLMAIKMTCSEAGNASISSVALHYEKQEGR